MIRNDLHVHSAHSACGMHTVLEIVRIGASKGMNLINISDHGKALGRKTSFGVIGDRRRLPDPVKALDGSSLRILRGMEANILDERGTTDIDPRYGFKLDLISAGFHPAGKLPGNGPEAVNTRALVNTCKGNPIDILTHACIITYPLDIPAVIDLSREYGFALEVNNTNLRLGKTNEKKLREMIQLAVERHAALVENSDGHTYYEIGENEKVEELIAGMGLDGNEIFLNRNDEKLEQFLSSRKKLRRDK